MRFFTSDIRRNVIKILCLTVGMSIGFLLIAKVYFESTYDTWFEESDRTFRIYESAVQNNEFKEYPQTPGAIAPGFKRYCPQVEAATRYTWLWSGEMSYTLEDGRNVAWDNILMADSSFFDVFPTRIIEGNPRDVLETASMVMIPRSLAEKIGGNVVGQQLTAPQQWDDYKMTIGGVYEDFPLNSSVENAVYAGLPTIGLFSGDGRDNWVGNDRYVSYLRLYEGANEADLIPNIEKMKKENVDEEALTVFHLDFSIKPLIGQHSGSSGVKTMIWILTLLAVVMLMCAGLNYLLVVFGQMGKRSKEMAVRKCYGTSNIKIFFRVMSESLFYLVVSLGLAVLLVECFGEECRHLLGYTPEQLFSTGRVWFVMGIVVLSLAVLTGCMPAWIYCRTPVTHAFRSNLRSRKGWKLALLSLQFFATGMLICVLVLVMRQYSMLTSMPLGYDYENLGYVDLSGVPEDQRNAAVAELRKLSEVKGVASADVNFTNKIAGNNVWMGDDGENQFNVADMYWANPDFMDVVGMEFVKGGTFRQNPDTTVNEAIVDERFVEALKKYYGVKGDDILGQRFKITEHIEWGFNEFTIVGVFKTLTLTGIDKEREDMRPQVLFPAGSVRSNVFIRFSDMNQETMKKAHEVLASTIPGRELYILPYVTQVRQMTAEVESFGASVMIVGIAILIIAMVGLIGYVSDEVQRRSKEIAIRKVTGYRANQIIKLFCKDIIVVALPSMVVGGALAMVVGSHWLSQFTNRVGLSPLSMVACILCLLIIVAGVVTFNSWRVANSNPVDHLRNE